MVEAVHLRGDWCPVEGRLSGGAPEDRVCRLCGQEVQGPLDDYGAAFGERHQPFDLTRPPVRSPAPSPEDIERHVRRIMAETGVSWREAWRKAGVQRTRPTPSVLRVVAWVIIGVFGFFVLVSTTCTPGL